DLRTGGRVFECEEKYAALLRRRTEEVPPHRYGDSQVVGRPRLPVLRLTRDHRETDRDEPVNDVPGRLHLLGHQVAKLCATDGHVSLSNCCVFLCRCYFPRGGLA